MTNANDARKAHKILDDLFKGSMVLDEEREFLRSFLPELPKPVTLDDLLTRVHDAWMKANPSDWGFDTPAEHHDWLFDLRNDLVHIIEDQDTPATVPALPDGMRIADHESYGRVVVSPGLIPDGRYQIFVLDSGTKTGAECEFVHPDTLTFIDDAPAKSAHPEFLETEADYQNAPEGTIVACEDSPPWHKFGSEWSSVINYEQQNDKGMSRAIRQVLRWGWS